MAVLSIGRLLQSFSPYRIIACYTIFFVVRAKGDSKDRVDNEVTGPIEVLLGDLIQENTLNGGLRHSFVQRAENVIPDELPDSDTFLDIPVPNISIDMPSQNTASNRIQTDNIENNGTDAIFDDKFPQVDIFSFLPVFAPISSKVRTEDCRKHSRIFLHQLKKYKLWALQMASWQAGVVNSKSRRPIGTLLPNWKVANLYDSSAKLPSGLLRGNVNQLGDFDQCLSAMGSEPNTSTGLIRGQYCLASIDISSTLHALNGKESLETPVHWAQSMEFVRSSRLDPGHFIPQFSTIKWGLCVPHSCTPDDVDVTLKDALEPFSTSLVGIQIQTRVEPDMCYVDQPTEFGVGTYVVMLVYSSVIAIALIATLRDDGNAVQLKYRGKLEKMLMAFSIKKTLPELLSVEKGDGDIKCIHGVRALATVALYVAHKVLALAFLPYSNRIHLTQLSQEPLSMLLRASFIYTDSFLLLSGVLTAYHMSCEMKRKGGIDWKRRYLARFIRLAKHIRYEELINFLGGLDALGNGPMWNKVVKRNADLCKVSMWKNMLYVQNIFPFEEMCATHTHQLSLDMQLSLVAPLLVYLLFVSQGWGILLLLVLHVISGALRYYVSIQNNLSMLIYHRMTWYLVFGGWLSASYLAYLSFFSTSEVASPDYWYEAVETSLYSALSPVTWSLALCWVILACATGYGGWLNSALCWRGLTTFSKISYSVYLTQFAVFFYNVGTTRTSQEFNAITSAVRRH
uniref:Nose resistant-to-fluoxetine protein N-terminal domain-containing protein n=1 Tax=Timema shepardi TaxID=629360 RepID=A0A7R9AKX3_TIMSH|nr:unnamed protein product [Timema shepardi]